MTLFEVTALGSLIAVGTAAFALWHVPAASARRTDATVRDAAALRDALASFREHGGAGCPSLSQLVEEGHLDPAQRTDDPWGSRFRIDCAPADAVVSAGPDRKLHTADDIALDVAD